MAAHGIQSGGGSDRLILERLDEILRRQLIIEDRLRQLEWRVDLLARDLDSLDRRQRPFGDGQGGARRRRRT